MQNKMSTNARLNFGVHPISCGMARILSLVCLVAAATAQQLVGGARANANAVDGVLEVKYCMS